MVESPLPTNHPPAALPACAQELERGEGDVLECDALASCLYVNEPKVKVDLTKYNERHTFRQASQPASQQSRPPAIAAGCAGECLLASAA